MDEITPTAAREYIAKSPNDFLASEIEPLEQQLEALLRDLRAGARTRTGTGRGSRGGN